MSETAKVTLKIANFCNETNWNDKYFYLPPNNQTQFRLLCYFQNTKNILNTKYTTICLCNTSNKLATVRYQMSILNSNCDKCDIQERVETFDSGTYGGLYNIKYDHLAKLEHGYLVDGNLTIYCEVEELDPTTTHFSKYEIKQDLPDNPITDDYRSLLESGKFSDASLIVAIGEKRLLVHKAILSARSKVFAAMFENDCEEKHKNRVEIIDIPAEVCEQMLSYIYTGKTPDMSKYAADLFVVADKYELEHLKAVCEHHLSTKIDVESAAITLLIADMHHTSVLKTKASDFIVDNASKVMATEGWKVLTKSRMELVLDLFQKLAIKTNH